MKQHLIKIRWKSSWNQPWSKEKHHMYIRSKDLIVTHSLTWRVFNLCHIWPTSLKATLVEDSWPSVKPRQHKWWFSHPGPHGCHKGSCPEMHGRGEASVAQFISTVSMLSQCSDRGVFRQCGHANTGVQLLSGFKWLWVSTVWFPPTINAFWCCMCEVFSCAVSNSNQINK